MVVVPAGEFIMGSPPSELGRFDHEGPQHNVVIARPFAVARFDVTFDDWDACAAYGDCDPSVSDSGFGRGRQPVINVTWDDARDYAAWLSRMTGKSYRLLSEAEFEYAARAESQTAYPWGNEIGKNNANCINCGSRWDNRQPSPVGSFATNRFGYMTCTATSGSGPRIAITKIMREHRRTARRGRALTASVSSAAVPGTSIQRASGRPTATGAPPFSGAAASASGAGGRSLLLKIFTSLPLGSRGEAPGRVSFRGWV